MSRTATQTRLQDFDEDSDEDDYQSRAAVRKTAERRPYTLQANSVLKDNAHDSTDDSQDENDSRLRTRNTVNPTMTSYNTSKQGVRGSSVRRIVSKPAGSSNGPISESSGGTKGFVPRDLSNKVRRNPAPHEDSRSRPLYQPSQSGKSTVTRDEDEEDEERSKPAPWATAPKKFLADPAPEPMHSSKIPLTSGMNQTNIKSRGKQPTSQPPTRQRNQPPPVRAVSEEDQDDDQSVESSNTVEEFETPQTVTVDHGRQPSMFDPFTTSNPPRNMRAPGHPNKKHLSLQFEDRGDEFDTEVIKDGEFYTDYIHRSQAFSSGSPASQPVKSGRYEKDGEESPSWAAVQANSKSSWASVQGPPTNVPGGAQASPTNRFSFVLIAHPRGVRTEHVQCTVIRDRRASINGKLHPTYSLILDETKKTILLAQKMNMNRTSNYHLFDLTRASLSKKLSKKSGNYLGKLRAKNTNRTEYVLLNQNSEREEIAGVKFDRVTLMDQLKDGNQPRKMKIMVPPVDRNNIPIPNRTQETDAGSLAEKLGEYESTALGNGSKDLFVFESKDPVFENGNFRLNFHGRVNKPSVKNFQMVSREDIEDVICQFGKVDEDIFHLDFKAPLNACQAFAFALCQFNL